MEDGTFLTGLELNAQPSSATNQVFDSKPKVEEKTQMPSLGKAVSKQNRSTTAGAKSVQPTKTESFPQLQNTREVPAKSSGLRSSMTEANFKKPLFKKLANMKEMLEKTKTANGGDRVKSSANRPATHWSTKKQDQSENEPITHADVLNQKIVQKFNDMYQTQKSGFNSGMLEGLSKRKHFFNEIEKQETKVQGEQKKYNDLAYEISQNEKLLDRLKTQDQDIGKKLVDTTDLENALENKQNELDEWKVKIEIEEYNHDCLQNMKADRKKALLNDKKRCLECKEMVDKTTDEIAFQTKEVENIKTAIRKTKFNIKELKNKQGMKDNLIDSEFEDLLENEISEFEERRNLREILKHEKVIEEELRLQVEEEERMKFLAKENKLREEENKRLQKEAEHEKELNKIKKQYNEFQKVTHVTRKDQLIQYFDGLNERGEVLEKEIKAVEEDIKVKKQELEESRKQLKFKKFEETKASKDKFPQDIRLDDLEVILRNKTNEVGERENHIARLEKLSYEVCTVVSRVLKQLQKTKTPMPVDQSNVGDLLSICGLKLERMLTVVIKKRKTFFIESINTDGTIKEGPPTYMNLVSDDVYNKSKKRFEKEMPVDIEEESGENELTQLRGQIKNKDEHEAML